MRPHSLIAVVCTLTISGCYPFITGGRYDARLCELDEDGDGNLRCDHTGPNGERIPADCDDNDPARSHLHTEIPYDGIDNNCSGRDLIDVDGDGFPGIARADYEALGGLPWPTGQREEVDCNDNDPSIYPGAPEIYYDGVDQNCDGLCDYDADQDGFADRIQGIDNDCDLPATDCDDTNAAIYPGAPGDVPYDGIDTDCDGTNDFDPDGDGFVWAAYQAQVNQFLARYGYDDTVVAYTECFDVDDDLPGATVAPELINPDQPEVYYNGFDDDCSDVVGPVVNDFDKDKDGFMPGGLRDDFIDYVRRYHDFERQDGAHPLRAKFVAAFGGNETAWGNYYDAHSGDCDDEDANVNPAALEVVGDGVDRDCDGHPNTSPSMTVATRFTELGQHRVTTTNDHFVLLAASLGDATTGASTVDSRVWAWSLPLDAQRSTSFVTDQSPWLDSPVRAALAVSPFGNGYFTHTSWPGSSDTIGMMVRSIASSSAARNYDRGSQDAQSLPGLADHVQAEMAMSGDVAHVVACDDTFLHFVAYDTFDGVTSLGAHVEAVSTIGCFLHEGEVDGYSAHAVRDGSPILSWNVNDVDGFSAWTPGPFDGVIARFGRNHGDRLVLGLSDRVALHDHGAHLVDLFEDTDVLDADAVVVGGTVYGVAIEQHPPHNRVLLETGAIGGSLTVVEQPIVVDGEPLTAERIAIAASSSRVLIVVQGTDAEGDQRLAWVILGREDS